MKYDSNAKYYTTCELRDKKDIFQQGSEVGTTNKPFYYYTTVKEDGELKEALGIFPKFSDSTIENAIEIEYSEFPVELSTDTDKAKLPGGFDEALYLGAIAKAYEQKQDMKNANQYWAQYELVTSQAIGRYQPMRSLKINLPRKMSQRHRRIF